MFGAELLLTHRYNKIVKVSMFRIAGTPCLGDQIRDAWPILALGKYLGQHGCSFSLDAVPRILLRHTKAA